MSAGILALSSAVRSDECWSGRHALAECSHFLGLFWCKVSNQDVLLTCFRSRIAFCLLLPGISSLSDAVFLLKLIRKMSLPSAISSEQD
ncbi:hypothetical protein [Enterobacter sp.]|uniref:hypothetical protein n=1 Tax=Enterobacter sp. TaxID=42895 RepID=UPI003D0D7D54